MRKVMLGLVGSTLMVAAMGSAASADEYQTRPDTGYMNAQAQYAPGYAAPEYAPDYFARSFWYGRSAMSQSDTPWPKSGVRPDDWRQSGNGN